MKTNIFRQHFWLLDVSIGILFGLWIGRSYQLGADSGRFIFEKILIASLIGAFSYLESGLIGFWLSKKYQKIPSWLWISVLGSILFEVNKYVIWRLVVFVYYKYPIWHLGEDQLPSESLLNFLTEIILPEIIVGIPLMSLITAFFIIAFFLVVRTFLFFTKNVMDLK